MRKLLFAIFFLISGLCVSAQKPGAPIDVLHYDFQISLSDTSNLITGQAKIRFRMLKSEDQVQFDLIKQKAGGRGMLVTGVRSGSVSLSFSQEPEILAIRLEKPASAESELEIEIDYKGIPADGLIISKNKFGQRGFFADNWPNRARNWLPCIDHPADKATVNYAVTAPLHYQVVANGIQVEETVLNSKYKLTRYKEQVPIAPKVMVIGVADFAVEYAGSIDCIPVYSWVYPENREKGFYDYRMAPQILDYYIRHIGPYGYKKLANVQSKTRFGGLENANTIFYNERSVTGTRRWEPVMAHEIAHQWFGNMATEAEWAHLWLSEGFATYMSHLYMENKYGVDTLLSLLQNDRRQVVRFSHRSARPVVDSSVTDYMQLLNPNSYEKGGWVLHMLREEVGDSVFWRCIQTYYSLYAGKNATTEDFERVIEAVTGKDWKNFFRQWLYTPGQPELTWSWTYDARAKRMNIILKQLQKPLFSFPIEFRIDIPDQAPLYQSFRVKSQSSEWTIPVPAAPSGLVADPHTSLLFEQK